MPGVPRAAESLDDVIRGLRELRIAAGAPSYAEIATRMTALREERGLTPAAARVARSSVYDLFRPGRTRVRADLVVDVALALGACPAEADELRRRALELSAGHPSTATGPVATAAPAAWRSPLPVIVFAVACLGLNLFGNTVAAKFMLPIWLDTIGTATASFVLGPWIGVGVGVATNLLATVSGSPESLPFAAVNAVAAVVWGVGARRLRIFAKPWRLVPLGLGVAVASTVTAAPITVLLIGGLPSHGSAGLIATLTEVGADLWGAVFSANLLFSLADKQLSGWVAFGLAVATFALLPERPPGLSGFVRERREAGSGGGARR